MSEMPTPEDVKGAMNDPEMRVVLGIAVAAVTYLVIVGFAFNRR